METKKKGIFAKVALFVAAMIWGSSFFIVKNTVDAFPPNLLLAFRFTIAFLLLGAIFWNKIKTIKRWMIWRCGIVGLCLFLAYSTQTIGITDTSPGKNAFLTAVYCVIVPFLFWAVNKTKPDRYHIIAAVLCLGGIGLVSLSDTFTIGFGDGLTLISGFFYAAHIVAVAKFAKKIDPILMTILQFGVVAALSWIVGLSFESIPAQWTGDAAWGLVYLAVFATAGALLLQNVGQAGTNPSSAAIILSLESVFGVLFSVVFYGEQITWRMAAGFAIIFVAIILSETKFSFFRKTKPDVLKSEASNENSLK